VRLANGRLGRLRGTAGSLVAPRLVSWKDAMHRTKAIWAPVRRGAAIFASASGAPARRWLQTAQVAWIILAVAYLIKAIAAPRIHTVYVDFFAGGHNWWSGESMYDKTEYYYSPTFSLLFSPFTLFPDWLGQTLWNWLSMAAVFGALRTFFREVLRPQFEQICEGKFLLLCELILLRGIWSAQSNALILALLLWGAVAALQGRWWRAGLLLALPVHIKIWPLLAGALLALRWPKKLVGPLAAAIAGLALVPFLSKSPSYVLATYQEWIQCLTQRLLHGQRYIGYRDAWTIWEAFGTPTKFAYHALQAALGLAVCGACYWQLRRGKSAAAWIASTLGLWGALQLLVGPGTERMTYGLIAPALSWNLLVSLAERRWRWLAGGAWIAVGILGSGACERALLPYWSHAALIQPLGAVLLACWLVLHDWEWSKSGAMASASSGSAIWQWRVSGGPLDTADRAGIVAARSLARIEPEPAVRGNPAADAANSPFSLAKLDDASA
jgi:hypothetical protein